MSKHLKPAAGKKHRKPHGLNLSHEFRKTRTEKTGTIAHVKETVRTPISFRIPRYAALSVSVALLIAAAFIPADGWLRMLIFLIPLIIAGLNTLIDSIELICAGRYFTREAFSVLSSLMLFVCGEYCSAVLIHVFLIITVILCEYVDKQNSSGAESFFDKEPETVRIVTSDGVKTVPVDSAEKGDIISILPGELVPLDGVIVEGLSAVDTSVLSGVSNPVSVKAGSRLFSGYMNTSGEILLKVFRTKEASALYKVMDIARAAVSFKAPQQQLVEKAEKIIMPVLFAFSMINAVVIPAFSGEWKAHLLSSSLMLAVCILPALTYSVPLVFSKLIVSAANNGIILKGADCIDSLARTHTVIFEKTGTITDARFVITDVVPLNMSEYELVCTAALAETFSRHPIARAIKTAAGEIKQADQNILRIKETPGRGVSAFINDRQIYAGNTAYLESHGIKCLVPSKSGTAVHVAVNNVYKGYILVRDKVRKEAFDVLESIRSCGIKKLVLLTGDVVSVAKPVASRLNFDMFRAELTPDERLSAAGYLMDNKGEHSAVAYVSADDIGAGIMGSVDTGIYLGAIGSEAAYKNADVLFMDRDIKKLAWLFEYSRKAFILAYSETAAGFFSCLLLILLILLGSLSSLIVVSAVFIIYTAIVLTTFKLIR